ncbi:hypothetical protein LZ554_004575 [Drepanopeziza brunnea f. sp. 'monogermtubi']|nr:hypothetical protein LZ554_004575 [Drepanopeziza brunnea f. sp. 'monogermtubi']
MSWMDSWSRPSKSQATPPPFYLLPGSESVLYCRACGRVIGDRKKEKGSAASTPPKYCAARCKNHKRNGALDTYIESVFVSLLESRELPVPPASLGAEIVERIARSAAAAEAGAGAAGGKGGEKKGGRKGRKKGENRILVQCEDVERLVFGKDEDPERVFGRGKNRKRRGVTEKGEWRSVDMVSSDDEVERSKMESRERRAALKKVDAEGRTDDEEEEEDDDDDDDNEGGGAVIATSDSKEELDPDVLARLSIRSGARIRPTQDVSEVNGGVGGEKGIKERREETDEDLQKRREGQVRADGRESVRCAARRGVAFGFATAKGSEVGGGAEGRRLCEAVRQGSVVEASFAKGAWGIRWRE